ncbi:MAG: hypothetical protein ACI4JW_07625 [Oscillospiraceae bacterium]
MNIKKLSSAFLAVMLGMSLSVHASAMTELESTDVPHKFDLGTMEVGGSGVEVDEETGRGQNWVKVIQPFNEAHLFTELPDPDIAAVAVTFEISNWSGTEFPVGWGALLTYFDGSGNWYGFNDFKGISDYTINGDGEYTLVCDLGTICINEGQPYGLAMLQALEMVIDGVDEGDPTTIEVKSARVYYAGEEIEDAVLPDGTTIPIETAALILEGEEPAESETDSAESASEDATSSTAEESVTEETEAEVSEAAEKSSSASDSKKDKEEESSSPVLPIVLISCGAVLVVAVVALVVRKRK